MISMRTAVEQMAWADERLFAVLSELPDDAWRAKAGPDEWAVADLTFHLVTGADWYRYILGGPLQFTGKPESIDEVRALGPTWREINQYLLQESLKDDELMTFVDEGRQMSALRSTTLNQAVIHSTEHRVQIAAALKANGIEFPDLEDFCAWAYAYAVSHPGE